MRKSDDLIFCDLCGHNFDPRSQEWEEFSVSKNLGEYIICSNCLCQNDDNELTEKLNERE